MLATMDDDSKHGRWCQSHGMVATHEVPAITYDDINHTRNQEARAMAATTDDGSNHTRFQRPRVMSVTIHDVSDNARCQQPPGMPANNALYYQKHTTPATMDDVSNHARSQQPHTMPATTGDSSTMAAATHDLSNRRRWQQ